MRQTINGRIYDTASATLIGECMPLPGQRLKLYRKKTGEYFETMVTQTGHEYIAPRSAEDASERWKSWVPPEIHERIFRQPKKGGAINVYFSTETRRELDWLAEHAGKPRSGVIADAVHDYYMRWDASDEEE